MKQFVIAVYCFMAMTTTAVSQSINYKKENVSLLGTWDSPNVPKGGFGGNQRYSSCWGYSQKGREYAILGAITGTYVIDITNPKQAKEVSFISGGSNQSAIWREYKTYKNFLYCVSDDDHTFKIIDLSYLPDSTHVAYEEIGQSHTVTVDKDRLYLNAGILSTSGGKRQCSVFDLSNPAKPVFLKDTRDDVPTAEYTHDSYVKNDTIFASEGTKGLKMYYYDRKNNVFTLLGSITKYPSLSYNHSSLLMPDGKTLVMLDEDVAKPAVVVDVSDPSDMKIISTFSTGSLAITHNPFLGKNNNVVVSYYEDGIQIYNLSNPEKPVRTGFFDTHYQSETAAGIYDGVWSAYTELPSGNVIVLDMSNGLFVLDATAAYNKITTTKELTESNIATIFPNPATKSLQISVLENQEFDFEIIDNQGKKQISGQNNTTIDVSNLSSGSYFLNLKTKENKQLIKFIKH